MKELTRAEKVAITEARKHGSIEKWKAFQAKTGKKGGLAKVPKGFAINKQLARIAGAKGGRISRRKSKD